MGTTNKHRSRAVFESMRESEINFRSFFETIGDLVVVAAPDGFILYANTAVTRKLGYSQVELRSMCVLDMHPADKRAEAQEIFSAMSRGERDACPLPLITRDGQLVPVETRIWAGQWNGEACVFGLCKDLSVQEEARQRFERLFRNNPALMAVSDLPERRFFDVNEVFLSTLGYSREEVIGKTVVELGLFPDLERQNEIADKLKATGSILNAALRVRAKDGTVLDGLFSGEMISSHGRQYFLTVMVDITARKRAEEEVRKLNEELRSRVREGMEELIHVSRVAVLGQIVAAISHELNQPLGAILNWASSAKMVLSQPVPDIRKARSMLSKIIEVDTRAASVIRRIRGLVKKEARELERLDIETLVRQVVDIVRGDAALKGAAIELHFSPGRKVVVVDKVQLQQVMLNLIINGLEACAHEADKRLLIQTDLVKPGHVRVGVTDHGPGFDGKDVEVLFQPFYTTKKEGLGIGLFICRSIVQAHGGEMTAYNNSGRGATFLFSLPLAVHTAGRNERS